MASELELWTEQLCEIATPDGMRPVEAVVHPRVPGLAVTMEPFGQFAVTHMASGYCLPGGPWERAVNAMLAASKISAVLQMAGLTSAPKDKAEISAALVRVAGEPVPFASSTVITGQGKRPMTVGEWWRYVLESTSVWRDDEFPDEDEHPSTEIAEILQTLAIPTAPAAPEVAGG